MKKLFIKTLLNRTDLRRLVSGLFMSLLIIPWGSAHAITPKDLHAAVYDTVFYDDVVDPNCGVPGAPSQPGVPPTGNAPQDVWNNLRAKGFNPIQTAGIMGNMQSESGFDPLIIEGGGHSNDPAAAGSGGYGLVQWTPGAKLIPYLHGQPPAIAPEINALWEQLQGLPPSPEKGAGDALRAAVTLQQASDAFELKYERHAGGPQPARFAQAQAILAKYGGGAPGTPTPSTGSGVCNSPYSTASGPLGDRIAQIATAELGTVGFMKYDSANENWCADFVSWVLRQAGAALTGGVDTAGYRIPGVTSLMDWFKTNPNRAQWFDNNGANVPQKGDILIHGSAHTNIAVDVRGTVVTEIGGNQGCAGHVDGVHTTSCVTSYSENIRGSDITGWGRMIK